MAFTTAALTIAVDALAGPLDFLCCHDGDPGGSGTANRIAEIDPAAVSFPGATAGVTTASPVAFTVTGACGPVTHCSVWDGDPDAGGVYRGSGAVSPAETFAGAGTLNVTPTITGSSS